MKVALDGWCIAFLPYLLFSSFDTKLNRISHFAQGVKGVYTGFHCTIHSLGNVQLYIFNKHKNWCIFPPRQWTGWELYY